MKSLRTIWLAKLKVTGNSQNAVLEMGLGVKNQKIFYTDHFSLGVLHCFWVCHKYNLFEYHTSKFMCQTIVLHFLAY